MKIVPKRKKRGATGPSFKKIKKEKNKRTRASRFKANPANKLTTGSSGAAVKKKNVPKKAKNDKALLVEQEVKFARLLAHNDKKVRDKVLKNLKRWLNMRSQSSFTFTEEDFLRLWKGLFYCMWMSDKPLVQEELAESLSYLVHCFNSLDTALLYTKCTLKSLATEWFGIDRHRMDKFEMLVRRILRQTLIMCKNKSWKKKYVIGVSKVIEEILLDPKACMGLKLHITGIYMEELAKICEKQIPESMVTEFIRPYVIYLVSTSDIREINHIIKSIFRYLIFQSDVGSEYLEKFEAWKLAKFPCTNIDELQKIELSDDEDEAVEEEEEEEDNVKNQEQPLDPRAGRVDVVLHQIPFDAAGIVKVLKENKFHKTSTTITRKHITKLIDQFTKLTQNEMPIGIKKIPEREEYHVDADESAIDLLNFNKDLYSDSSKNRKRKKNDGEVAKPEDGDKKQDAVKKKIKKPKSDNSKESDIPIDNAAEIKQEKKAKVETKTKLNVLNPLPGRKVKKSSKNKLNKTVSKLSDESKDENCSDKKIKKNLTTDVHNTIKKSFKKVKNSKIKSELSNTPIAVSVPNTLKAEKINEKKKVMVLAKKKKNSLFETNSSWLTPVLTRLEDTSKMTPVLTRLEDTSKMTPVLTRLEDISKTPSPKKFAVQTPKTDSVKKHVKIALQKNMAQNTSEYFRKLLQNPGIPFDANRKPKAGVLKPSPLPSPINPFYKKKLSL